MSINLDFTNYLTGKIYYLEYLSKNLKVLRKSKKLSQDEICVKLGFINETTGKTARSKWSNYETGNSQPILNDLIKIAKFFDISETKLLHTDISNEVSEPKEAYHKTPISIDEIKNTLKEKEDVVFNKFLSSYDRLVSQNDYYFELLKDYITELKNKHEIS